MNKAAGYPPKKAAVFFSLAHWSPPYCGNPCRDLLVLVALESFYDSPSDFSLTKSPVLKPTPGRISRNTVPLATQTSSFDSPLQIRKDIKLFFFHNIHLRVGQQRNVRLKKSLVLGGAIVVRISRCCRVSMATNGVNSPYAHSSPSSIRRLSRKLFWRAYIRTPLRPSEGNVDGEN